MRKYEECATRLENRGAEPPTKEYTDKLIEAYLSSGVEAAWHSGVDPVGRPLFPSRVIPNCHPEANLESFHYLIKRMHEIGRPIMSWYPLVLSRSVTEAHPDWQMKFIDFPGKANPESEVNYACYNSPYGKMLPDFAVELVQEVGFDGIWFDGSDMSNHNTTVMFQPGCKCHFCRERFKKDTGLDLPEKVDFENHTFRIWVNWRYEILMEVWRNIVQAVTQAKPEATVCFNNLRRRHAWGIISWNTAIPMRPLQLNAVLGGELDCFPFQADIQMKINRAYGFTKGVESWHPLLNYYWAPGFSDKLTAVQAVLGCVSAGGVAACGVANPEPNELVDLLKKMEAAAAPRIPYLGGEVVEYAAIAASQQTMDFWAKDEPDKVWNGIHGANEILLHSHLQSSVVFDAHLAEDNLSKYPVVLLGNMVCVSEKQAEGIRKYVAEGGVLLACDQVGELDELGYPHKRPILDDMLGIVSREKNQRPPSFHIVNGELAAACSEYPIISVEASSTKVGAVSDAMVLARIYAPLKAFIEKDTEVWPGVWKRKHGKGQVIYIAADIFNHYLVKPIPALQKFFRALMDYVAKPKITLDGPIVVTMNVRKQKEGEWIVHLHNNPGPCYRYPNPPNTPIFSVVGEVVPVRNVMIRINTGLVRTAKSALSGKRYKIMDKNKVLIPEITLQEIVLLKLE